MARTHFTRERFLLLHELRLQLGHSPAFRKQTERAIAQIERELAGNREVASRAACGEQERLRV